MSSIGDAIAPRFWDHVSRFLGPSAAHGIRLVSGGSATVLGKRAARLWAMGRSMLRAEVTPPKPIRMQIETTDICNLKCRMCAREALDGMDTRTMTFPEFKRLIDAVRPFYATLNGLGEPLNDKTIFEKLEYLHANGIFSSMPTNGSFVYGKRLEKLVENFPDALTVSIDGATKESFEYIRKLANFDNIIRNLKSLVDRRKEGHGRSGTLRILCALQRANLFDYRAMYQLVMASLGIEAFNLVPIFDYGAEATIAELVPSRDEVMRLHGELDRAIAETSDPKESAFYANWKGVSSGWLSEQRVVAERNVHACAVPWYSSYVDAKGRVYPCCYLLTTDHVMGNVNESSFDEVWEGEKYQEFRRRLITDRPNLNGCAECPRNDDGLLKNLAKYHPLFATSAPAPPDPVVPKTDSVPKSPRNGERLVQLRTRDAARRDTP